MENESRFALLFRNFSDKIQDQVWFQQLKVKWDELDARAKIAIKYTSLIGGTVLTLGLVGTNLYSVAEKKKNIDERLSLITKIQSAQDELRRLKDVTSRFNGADAQPWAEFLQSKAPTAGFDPSVIKVVSEKIVSDSSASGAKDAKTAKDTKTTSPASGITGPEETVLEAEIKHINVRQLVKFVHEVENGGRTVKVRRLKIDTNPDASGFLDATLSVSAFKLKQ